MPLHDKHIEVLFKIFIYMNNNGDTVNDDIVYVFIYCLQLDINFI